MKTLLLRLHGLLLTLLMWGYFLFGFLGFYAPRYLLAALRRDRATAFQGLTASFYEGFFRLILVCTPWLQLRRDPEIARLRSAIVICNHLSYLDPLLLAASLPRAVTLVKGTFFHVPVLSWIMRGAGYIPAGGGGRVRALALSRLGGLERHLAGGGCLFVFPEGTRARDGQLGPFQSGAFKLARRHRAPLVLLRLRGTGDLFPRAGLLLRTWRTHLIELEVLDTLPPVGEGTARELEDWIEQARRCYRR